MTGPSIEGPSPTARRADRGAAADKKAIDIVELDLRGVLGYTDYFVICSGNTDRQTKAIHDGIHEGLKKDHGLLPRRVEGVGEARWILMDYLDVVVHIFTPRRASSTGSSSSGARRPSAPSASSAAGRSKRGGRLVGGLSRHLMAHHRHWPVLLRCGASAWRVLL